MKRVCFALLIAFSALPAGAAIGVTGAWTLNFDPNFGGMPQTVECALEQEGLKVTGDCAGVPVTGEVDDPKVTFRVKVGPNGEFTGTFNGEYDDQIITIRGMWHLADGAGEREGKFSMLRHE
jgi:hypothetical protein